MSLIQRGPNFVVNDEILFPNWEIKENTSDHFEINNNGNNKFKIENSTGKVSIANTLEVNGVLKINSTIEAVDNISFETDGEERMTITDVGNVGIGNDDPDKKLSIVNSSGTGTMEIRSNSESNDTLLFLGTPYNSSAKNKTAIIAEADGSYSSSNLHFCLNSASDNSTEVSLSDQKMTILKNGNVGIGNNNPSYKLDVDGTANFTGAITGNLTGNASGSSGSCTGNSATATILETARTIGGVSFNGSAAITPANITVADTTDTSCSVALFESATGDLPPKTDGGLTYNAGTGILVVDGSVPRIGIGTDNPLYTLHIFGNQRNRFNEGRCIELIQESKTTTASGDYLACFDRDSTAVCKISGNGDLNNTNGQYGTLSDRRVKENIVDANSQWDDIKNIKIVNYNLINNDLTQIGVIAQQVETICPGLVKTSNDSTKVNNIEIENLKTFKSSILYMKSVKALQEAMQRIEQLESKLNELEHLF